MNFKITRLWDGTKDFSKDADILVTLSGNKCSLSYVKECTSRKYTISLLYATITFVFT